MTKKINLAILFAVASIYSLAAQESAIPSLTAPESLSLGFRPRESSPDPLRDSGALKLSDRGQNVHLELASGRRGVDALR